MRFVMIALTAALMLTAAPARAEDRPANCPRTLWCGCWLANYLGIQDAKLFHELWSARRWASFGHRASGPAPGVIAVFRRGKHGGHVGIVTAVPRDGIILMKSGNDAGAVRERERPIRNVIAWRVP